jgi:Ti-type conjugative transfer relaxase TraA
VAIAVCKMKRVSAGWSKKTAAGKLRGGPAGRSSRKPGSAVEAESYFTRTRLTNRLTGKRHDNRYRPDKLDKGGGGDGGSGQSKKKRRGPTHGVLRTELLLPPGADKRFKSPSYLWSEAERAELITVRKTGKVRFRQGAELARQMILALPKELSLDLQTALVKEFCQQFLDAGLAVRYAIHPSDNPATGNIHAHLLITSRAIEGDRFSKYRCTLFRPDFSTRGDGQTFVSGQSEWPQKWLDFQNRFFAERDIPLQVDPISVSPRIHEGPSRPGHNNRKTVINQAISEHEAKVLRDPAELLRRMTERSAIFGIRDLERLLAKAGITGMEAKRIIQTTLLENDAVPLDNPPPKGIRDTDDHERRAYRLRFTTKAVLAQEERIRENLRTLANRAGAFPLDVLAAAERLAVERGLDPEQVNATRFCLEEGSPIPQAQGSAGAGKTVAATVIHDALASTGFTVIGAAPTNAAAGVMRKDGIKQAMTLHRLLGEVEDNARTLDRLHVIIVDEAAMVDVDVYDRLLSAAASSGCRVMLIGDDRQLPPVGRGGAYSMIGRMFGQATLKNIRRQKVEWMREASKHLSRWEIGPAIQAYNRNRAITWTQSPDGALAKLVENWGQAADEAPEKTALVLAGTNKAVDELNAGLQQRRWRGRCDLHAHRFTCRRGDVEVRVGERLQFYANDARKGIYNGTMATVTAVDPTAIHVHMDDGTEACFDPTDFDGWGLGYATTCYRSQGRTQDRVFLLYDHPFVWHAATTYVGLTRHREQVQLYVPRELAANEATLVRQMSRPTEQVLASDLVRADQDQVRRDLVQTFYPIEPKVPFEIGLADGSHQQVDLALEAAREAAVAHFKRTKVKAFVADYNKLSAVARSGAKDGHAEMVRRSVEDAAWHRGFKPSTGLPDPRCLRYKLLKKDQEYLYVDPLDRLSGSDDGGIDLRSIAFQPSQVPYRPLMDMAWRIRQLDSFVQDAIVERLNKLGRMFGTDEALSAVLLFATYLVKISKAIRHAVRDKTWPMHRRGIRTEVSSDGLVWEPFMLLNGRDERMVAPKRGYKDKTKARSTPVKPTVPPTVLPIEPALRPQRWESRAEARSRQETKAGSAGGAREDARQAGSRGRSTTMTQPASPML